MRTMLFMGCALLASGCVVREYRPPPPPPEAYRPPPPPPPPVVEPEVEVASAYVDPPVDQPPAVAIPWAPPPMRWDPPPPQPYVDAVWIGGHWTWWNGEWVWARGRWARPPTPGYVYCEPYYEYRGDAVVFVAGFWRPVVRVFVPPPPTVYIPVVTVRVVHVGYARPIGPHGVFVPAPPGSQPGVIVPAPVGTPPAVVLSAPPVVRPGMVVRPVPNRGVVEVVAPAGVTREGRPVSAQAPVLPRDAASVHPVVVASPPPVRNPTAATSPVFGHPAGPVTVGGNPVNVPVSTAPGPSTVSGRPQPPGEPGQPVMRPVLKPEAMGGEGVGPRPWSRDGERTGNEGPIVRPVPRPEAPARPPPVQTEPTPRAPVAQSEARPASPPVSSSGSHEAAPPHPRPVPSKVKPDERKGHPDRDPHEK
jgi:hypothetical protein